MKIKALTKLILSISIFTGAIVFGLRQANAMTNTSFGWKYPTTKFPSTGTVSDLLAYSDIRDPGGVPRGLPVRLKIPIIGVDSAIEDAYITSDGRMDVPAGSINVAWFALGPHPGQKGSAVIGGHFGIDKGIPKVFFNLNKLKTGDLIHIIDDKNNTLSFVVRKTKSFDRNADATTVFTSRDKLAHLNLITCEGVWNEVNDSYPQRLVIFTDAIEIKLPQTAVTTPKLTATLTPVLPTAPIVSENQIVDWLISTILILSIILMTVKIVKKYFFIDKKTSRRL